MLRLISYLAPSIPTEFFELVARVISEGAGTQVRLRFEQRISGPLPGDENPFRDATADVGFVCSPTYRWLKDELHLLAAPVPLDIRASGRAVYFGDVVVRRDSPFFRFDDLRGRRWAYNDRNSHSGWFSMLDRVAPLPPREFFSQLIHTGSHLESLRQVESGRADAAAIDSNALLNEMGRRGLAAPQLRVVESWGPFQIQPIVIRNGIPASVRSAVRDALLSAHETFGEQLASFEFVRFAEAERAAYEA